MSLRQQLVGIRRPELQGKECETEEMSLIYIDITCVAVPGVTRSSVDVPEHILQVVCVNRADDVPTSISFCHITWLPSEAAGARATAEDGHALLQCSNLSVIAQVKQRVFVRHRL